MLGTRMASAPSSSDIPYHVAGSHVVDGILYKEIIKAEYLEQIKHLEVHGDDIYLCGFPKAGNTWLTIMTKAILSVDDLSSFEETKIDLRGHNLENHFTLARQSRHPALFSTSLQFQNLPRDVVSKKPKMIYIARNPKDVAVSFEHFHRVNETYGCWKGSWDVFIDAFLAGKTVYGSWYDHVRSYWVQRNAHNILFIKYEDMKQDLPGSIRKVAEFIGKPLGTDKVNHIARIVEFSNMKKNLNMNPDIFFPNLTGNFMRKGVVGDWKTKFTREQNARADAIMKKLNEDIGLDLYMD